MSPSWGAFGDGSNLATIARGWLTGIPLENCRQNNRHGKHRPVDLHCLVVQFDFRSMLQDHDEPPQPHSLIFCPLRVPCLLQDFVLFFFIVFCLLPVVDISVLQVYLLFRVRPL